MDGQTDWRMDGWKQAMPKLCSGKNWAVNVIYQHTFHFLASGHLGYTEHTYLIHHKIYSYQVC